MPPGVTNDSRNAAPGKTDRFRENFLRRMRKALERYSAIARSPDLLSQPEVATLQHLNRGYTNKEIARLLKVSPNTVKYRLKSLYEKLGVNSRRDAVRYSREHNLVDPERPRTLDRERQPLAARRAQLRAGGRVRAVRDVRDAESRGKTIASQSATPGTVQVCRGRRGSSLVDILARGGPAWHAPHRAAQAA